MGTKEEGKCLIPRIVPAACSWEVCWELEGLSLWIERAMRFKKLHMFFQSFMKYPICKDLSASSILPNSQNVVSNLPKRHPWQGAQVPHHCLGFVVGGWQSWNDALIFLSQLYMGSCFSDCDKEIFYYFKFQKRIFCCCSVQMKVKRVNIWRDWKVSPRRDRNVTKGDGKKIIT